MLFNRFSVRTAEVHQIAVQGIDSVGGKWGAVAGAGCRLGCETPAIGVIKTAVMLQGRDAV